jgi:hypothetical protein
MNDRDLQQKLQTLINHVICGRCPRCCERLEFMSGRFTARLQTLDMMAESLQPILLDTTRLAHLHNTVTTYYHLDTKLRKQMLDLEDIHPEDPDAKVVEEMDRYTRILQNNIPILRLVDDNIHIVHMLSYLIANS